MKPGPVAANDEWLERRAPHWRRVLSPSPSLVWLTATGCLSARASRRRPHRNRIPSRPRRGVGSRPRVKRSQGSVGLARPSASESVGAAAVRRPCGPAAARRPTKPIAWSDWRRPLAWSDPRRNKLSSFAQSPHSEKTLAQQDWLTDKQTPALGGSKPPAVLRKVVGTRVALR